ncbi:hypothetical protein pqer_cds_584 [Pandoravirus quercus]|uniref:F-box incomplete domain containing protein n=1 Tax=Pandoravirus quercus TaxID=2107709 RepID=A0A2U7U999_9VIRU|nr:hypothetical protein pqer_cds_584 [Pandoravirus quercus]AVK75006.1 hypothetical protein pqer_cds_584 [Pandoravirus quercus]
MWGSECAAPSCAMDTRPWKRVRYATKATKGTSAARGATTTTTTSWAHLPGETWDLILNGTDSHGRPFLDWRWRVAVRATCRRLHDVVSTPSATDRTRLAGRTDPFGKRAIGAVVSVTVAAQLLASAPPGATLDDLVALVCATYLAHVKPSDPHMLAAAALTGTERHVAAVGAILTSVSMSTSSPMPFSWESDDSDDNDDGDDIDGSDDDAMEIDPGDRADDGAVDAAALVYRACVAHGCASGADIAAPFLSLGQLMEPVQKAIRADDVDAVLSGVRHAKRAASLIRARERQPLAMHPDTLYDQISERVWTAILRHGTPSVAVALVGEVYQDSLVLKVRRLERHSPLRVCSVSCSGAPSFDAGERWSDRPHAMADAVRLLRRAIVDGDVLVAAWVVACYQNHVYHTTYRDPPFGPLSVDDVVRLAVRAGTYAHISLWLTEWTDNRPSAAAIAAALTDATARRSISMASDVDALANDWTREVVDARGGQALVTYLACSADHKVASGPARQAMPPSSGPIVRGLWAYHARAVRRAWEADDMTRLCKSLLALCGGARRWGLIDAMSLDGARAWASGTRDEWTVALEHLSAETPDGDLWAPWRGAVQPLAETKAIREAAFWWVDSDERSIVLGALDLLNRALDIPHGPVNASARPPSVPFL